MHTYTLFFTIWTIKITFINSLDFIGIEPLKPILKREVTMIYPMYFFSEDFTAIEPLLETVPFRICHFKEGDYLWTPGDSIEELHYIKSGVVQLAMNHPSGRERIISFHGRSTLFPVFYEGPVQLEDSLEGHVLTETHTVAIKKTIFIGYYIIIPL